MEKRVSNNSIDGTPAKRSTVVQRNRDRNDGDVQVKVQKNSVFRAQLEETTRGKYVSQLCGNIVYNHH